MKAGLEVFLLAVLCSTLAAVQNPYPTGCNGFDTETVYCNDLPGQGSCHGSLQDVIVTPNGDGTSFGTPGTLSCTGGTVNCPGTNSPTCPTCKNGSYYVSATNPACIESGGGGGGGDPDPCDDAVRPNDEDPCSPVNDPPPGDDGAMLMFNRLDGMRLLALFRPSFPVENTSPLIYRPKPLLANHAAQHSSPLALSDLVTPRRPVVDTRPAEPQARPQVSWADRILRVDRRLN
jgi:hypothetical protein